ncbi:unnamed protein product [Acanthosepion pharaonis]|uniref:Uncharacterized protein n=1 Tax=Acanthosepion pharaonis TaxID=158019 RepID=A0A812BTL1_ACAPH|nr:unnamed protein product [Sepia pharaonis]
MNSAIGSAELSCRPPAVYLEEIYRDILTFRAVHIWSTTMNSTIRSTHHSCCPPVVYIDELYRDLTSTFVLSTCVLPDLTSTFVLSKWSTSTNYTVTSPHTSCCPPEVYIDELYLYIDELYRNLTSPFAQSTCVPPQKNYTVTSPHHSCCQPVVYLDELYRDITSPFALSICGLTRRIIP